jgi:hypothetical protein
MTARVIGRLFVGASLAAIALVVASCAIPLRGGDDANRSATPVATDAGPIATGGGRCAVVPDAPRRTATERRDGVPDRPDTPSDRKGAGGRVSFPARKDKAGVSSGDPFVGMQSE